jgi:Na+/H+ antiporter NhaD/arsenite permease-like protein
MDLGHSNSLVDAVFVAGLLAVVLVGLALNLASAEKLFTAALMMLLLGGVLAPADAFVGFSNPGIFTIAALYVVVGGLKESGATQVLRRYMVGSPKNQTSASLRVLPVTTILSAVVNNTPVVAMFTTLLQSQSKRFSIRLSSILIPVSYASILGGTCTLIGTSTNLVVDGMLQQSGYAGFGLFEIAWVGILVLIYILVVWHCKSGSSECRMLPTSTIYTCLRTPNMQVAEL